MKNPWKRFSRQKEAPPLPTSNSAASVISSAVCLPSSYSAASLSSPSAAAAKVYYCEAAAAARSCKNFSINNNSKRVNKASLVSTSTAASSTAPAYPGSTSFSYSSGFQVADRNLTRPGSRATVLSAFSAYRPKSDLKNHQGFQSTSATTIVGRNKSHNSFKIQDSALDSSNQSMKKHFGGLLMGSMLSGVASRCAATVPDNEDKVKLLSVVPAGEFNDLDDYSSSSSSSDDEDDENYPLLAADEIKADHRCSSDECLVASVPLPSLTMGQQQFAAASVKESDSQPTTAQASPNIEKDHGFGIAVKRQSQQNLCSDPTDDASCLIKDQEQANCTHMSERESNKQEWVFTLYDFDGKGSVSHEDILSLVKSIYDVLEKVKIPVKANFKNKKSSTVGAFKIRLTVLVDPSSSQASDQFLDMDQQQGRCSKQHVRDSETEECVGSTKTVVDAPWTTTPLRRNRPHKRHGQQPSSVTVGTEGANSNVAIQKTTALADSCGVSTNKRLKCHVANKTHHRRSIGTAIVVQQRNSAVPTSNRPSKSHNNISNNHANNGLQNQRCFPTTEAPPVADPPETATHRTPMGAIQNRVVTDNQHATVSPCSYCTKDYMNLSELENCCTSGHISCADRNIRHCERHCSCPRFVAPRAGANRHSLHLLHESLYGGKEKIIATSHGHSGDYENIRPTAAENDHCCESLSQMLNPAAPMDKNQQQHRYPLVDIYDTFNEIPTQMHHDKAQQQNHPAMFCNHQVVHKLHKTRPMDVIAPQKREQPRRVVSADLPYLLPDCPQLRNKHVNRQREHVRSMQHVKEWIFKEPLDQLAKTSKEAVPNRPDQQIAPTRIVRKIEHKYLHEHHHYHHCC